MAIENKQTTALTKRSYMIMIIGAVVTIIGFFLMVGGGSNDPNVYNPAVYSFRRIDLSPILVLLGYAIVMYGILRKTKVDEDK